MPDPIIAELTLLDGNPVSVNLALVTHWAPADDNTIIFFSEDRSEIVMESYDTVSEYLNPERQAGA